MPSSLPSPSKTRASAKRLELFAQFSFLCLRANIARKLTGLAHREISAGLADGPLLQWFLHVGQIEQVKISAKSTCHSFEHWLQPQSLRKINDRLIALSIVQPGCDEAARRPFDLKDPVVVDEACFDTTCIKTRMHFPIEWVLLRDAVRTLVKGTICNHKAGLKHRMPPPPQDLLRDMNKRCMAMSALRRARDCKKTCGALLRQIKKLARRLGDHTQTHLDVLIARRTQTGLTSGHERVITRRLERVIKQPPAAVHRAHERIIGERQVRNEDRILSLCDENVDIIVRGEAGAEVDRPAAIAA